MADLNSDSPVLIDRVVFHAPTQTLRVYAHAKGALSYSEYCDAVRSLSEQASALNDIPKEILLVNGAVSCDGIELFCAEVIGERLPLAAEQISIACSFSDDQKHLELQYPKNTPPDDLAVLEESAGFVGRCF